MYSTEVTVVESLFNVWLSGFLYAVSVFSLNGVYANYVEKYLSFYLSLVRETLSIQINTFT
jgi:hypothetical protein